MIGFCSKYTDLFFNGRFQRTQQDEFLHLLDQRDIRLKEQYKTKFIQNGIADATLAYAAGEQQKKHS